MKLMRRYGALIATLTLLIPIAIGSSALAQDDVGRQFVGANKCRKCHKSESQGKQFGIWEETAHAKAYETLKSDEAAKIATEKGLGNAHEADECLKCHTTVNDDESITFSERFEQTQGVQCETCHGAGSDYDSKKTMQDREKSIAKGMRAIAVDDGSAEKWCKTCHNEESPTFKEFVFADMWDKIKHPVPEDAGE